MNMKHGSSVNRPISLNEGFKKYLVHVCFQKTRNTLKHLFNVVLLFYSFLVLSVLFLDIQESSYLKVTPSKGAVDCKLLINNWIKLTR